MAIECAEKHIGNAPTINELFFAWQSDFIDKAARWMSLPLSRGGCR